MTQAVIWALEPRPSLRSMRRTCACTVRSEMPSSVATWRFVRPFATSSATSRSRGVRASACPALPGVLFGVRARCGQALFVAVVGAVEGREVHAYGLSEDLCGAPQARRAIRLHPLSGHPRQPQQAVSYAHLVAHSTQQFEVLREVGLRPVGVARREADHAEGGEGDDGALDVAERPVRGIGLRGVG